MFLVKASLLLLILKYLIFWIWAVPYKYCILLLEQSK